MTVTRLGAPRRQEPAAPAPAAAQRVCIDGNEATARIAHKLSEVIAIYPITPASPMAELADAWSAGRRRNLWGQVPEVVEMQSEAGAAGMLHGAAMAGTLATSFTASQGLLLMLPNMFKLAGELTPAVLHVAARTVASHALSIFGDHSDVMAARTTGWAMLASGSPQEAHDLALVAHAASIRARVPFVHFFDGFRTSHELNRVDLLDDGDLAALVDADALTAHRARALTPDRPTLRGSAQNPDVFFQSREAVNPFYLALPAIVQAKMDLLAVRTGRSYHLVDYLGAPDAERVMVLMGSGAGAAAEAVATLTAAGERVGLLTLRLYRPFPVAALAAVLPPTVRAVAVLDRTKEPGAVGEPLYQDVVAALAEVGRSEILVAGGRYGLASKEFTPAMARAALDELARPAPRRHFTLGIVDDLTHLSLPDDPAFLPELPGLRAVFHGLGSDGTVGAVKAAAKILAGATGTDAQAFFVYDSKKSGSMTTSHLRVRPGPIRSTYLIRQAGFVAVHHFELLFRADLLGAAEVGAAVLLDSPYGPDEVWDRLPAEVQRIILDRLLDVWVVDARRIARDAGLAGRVNTVLLPCFLALSGLLPRDRALAAVHDWARATYARQGSDVVERNLAAIDRALDGLAQARIGGRATGTSRRQPVPDGAPAFVRTVTGPLLARQGDLLPVGAFPPDGAFPTGTARYEKRGLAAELPLWDPSLCVDCGKCTIVCPHAALRMKVYDPVALDGAPDGFQHKPFRARDLHGRHLTIQVAPDDCTGCMLCVDACPAADRDRPGHKALDMVPAEARRDADRAGFDFFLGLPELDEAARSALAPETVKGSQARQPLFEFSGACAGCGEAPYLKLLTQLFGDRLLVANATGCSSIFGGNLPTTPWAAGPDGRGPAWANSLFEDNAEFGLGLRVATDRRADLARDLLAKLAPAVGADLAAGILAADQHDEAGVAAQRRRVRELRDRLATLVHRNASGARELAERADDLVRKTLWIVGGDGWAYDIGSAGLDHVLASGRDVNVLVLDSEVYSNTGGQASKASPRGAVARFAARGKRTAKKDLGLAAIAYGNVYVAQVALGANDAHTVRVLAEAEAWPGPSLVIAYATCIEHGIDMATSMSHQREVVRSGYWPLFRYNPADGSFRLDSRTPTVTVADALAAEGRFAQLARIDPETGARLLDELQHDVDARWRLYQQLAGRPQPTPALPFADGGAAGPRPEGRSPHPRGGGSPWTPGRPADGRRRPGVHPET